MFLHQRQYNQNQVPSSSPTSLRSSIRAASPQLLDDASQCMSFVGTVTYMGPERIRGEAYRANTDVWSLGLSLAEAALGRFPYSAPSGAARAAPAEAPHAGETGMGFWDILDQVRMGTRPPSPTARLPTGRR